MKPSALRVLSEDELDQIHETSLAILTDPGFLVFEPEAARVLGEAGAEVLADGDKARVRLPRNLVEAALARVAPEVVLTARRGEPLHLGRGRHYHFIGAEMTHMLDFGAATPRLATLDDLVRCTRLGDRLPLIDGITPEVYPQSVDGGDSILKTMRAVLTNTAKHCLMAPATLRDAQFWLDLGEIVAGDRSLKDFPVVGLTASSTPPLKLGKEEAGILMLAARKGVPLVLMPAVVSGMTAPITLAGSLAASNAQALFLVTLVQCIQPAAPVILWVGSWILDMRAVEVSEGGPESGLMSVAGSQLARRYHLPCYAGSAHCDAKLPDAQAGAEKMGCLLPGILAGLDFSINAGSLARCSVASLEQMVLDHEMLRYLQRFAAGITVNRETLALDVTRSVGTEGDFFTHQHTRRWLHSDENLYLETYDRSAGRGAVESLLERAHSVVQEQLAAWTPSVPEEKVDAIDRYIDDWTRFHK